MVQLKQESLSPVATRLKRAHGQLGAVIRMLEEGKPKRWLLDFSSQQKEATNRTAGYALVSAGLAECYENASTKNDVDLKKLEKLFLALA